VNILAKKKTSPVKRTAKDKLMYVKKNWQLYLFFLMPALLLTIIFKYLPMGGVLIAFEDYNVIDGILGSEWVGLEYFKRFLSSPDFMEYLMNTLKLSAFGLLWGFPIPIILALLLNRIRREGIRKKIQLLIYAPNFISVIVLCGMVRMFLSPVGPINSLLGIDKLDDNAFSFPYDLYCQRNLADSRMVIDYVYGCSCKCQQRSGRGGNRRWSKYLPADTICRASGDQKHHCDPVHPAGRKHYEYRI